MRRSERPQKELGARMTGGANQMELWEDNPLPQTLKIRADLVRLERSRDFGDVWLGWTLWKALQLDMLCASCMPEGKESVAWSTMAAVLVIARLCEPSSELHIAEDWYRKTALEDILDLPVERVNDDRLYRALDELLPHRSHRETFAQATRQLFSIEYDLLLYDVTSTYFEGLAEKNELAKRGHSRDHRSDCKQVCIALVVTREGLPLGYEFSRETVAT
ncbi:MAG: IS1634 family transposase [Polyangiaceae bacterium]|nr:IS1634 family transposase [Polyangiaceae bacterium]